MLIQFSVKNYKTFKDKATLSLVASGYDKTTREIENVVFNDKFNLRVLKSAVVYGANASGKSRLIDAMMFMKNFVIYSSKDSQKGDSIQVDSFRLNTNSEAEPSEFEAIFIQSNALYRYGFEVDKNHIVTEWLYFKPKTKEIELFYREEQNFTNIHNKLFQNGKRVQSEGLLRDNALFLSVASQFNEEIAILLVMNFLNLRIISGIREEGYKEFSIAGIKDSMNKKKILQLLNSADLGIHDLIPDIIEVKQLLRPDLPSDVRDMINKYTNDYNNQYVSDVKTFHKKYDAKKNVIENVSFSLDNDESEGTKKYFYLLGAIVEVLENGYTLVIDELDSKLHPNLVCKIVSLFNSKELNPNNAQLIFNTHDTNLLYSGLFRRDQIWFTEKNKYGEASLYSLADFKTGEVRKNEAYEDNYIKGKYGAVPYLGSFDSLSIGGKKNEK